jgi:ribonuclease BN (tRNA processing enzyme)
MPEIVVLGSGCGFAVQDRYNPSIALLVKDRCYLLDCGEPAAGSLFRAGIDPACVRAIFISHLHADHVGGLAQFLASINMSRRSPKKKFRTWSLTRSDDWYQSALRFPDRLLEGEISTPVDLCIPSEGISVISAYLEAVYLSPDLLPFDLNISPVELGSFYQDDLVSVSAIGNLHLVNNFRYNEFRKNHPGKSLQSYSFMIEVERKRMVYSGDIDNLAELTPIMDGADLLMVEITHYEPEGIKDFIDQYPLERVILCHIHPGLEDHIYQLVNRWDDPRISIAADGYTLKI